MLEDGETYRIISGHLGNPRLVVNTDTGEVIQRISRGHRLSWLGCTSNALMFDHMDNLYTKDSVTLRVAFYLNLILLAIAAVFSEYNSKVIIDHPLLTLLIFCLLLWPFAIHTAYVCVLSFPFNTFPNEKCWYPFKIKVRSGRMAKIGGVLYLFSIVAWLLFPFIAVGPALIVVILM